MPSAVLRSNFTRPRDKAVVATVLLLVGTLFWGMTFVFIKEAVTHAPVPVFLLGRFTVAVLLLAALFPRRLRRLNGDTLGWGCLLGLVLAVSFVTQTVGIRYSTASKAAFITGLSVVLVPLLAAATDRKWPAGRDLLAAGIALAGLAVMTLELPLRLGPGDGWVMLAAVAFAVYIVLVGRQTHGRDAVALTIVQFAVMIVVALFWNGWSIASGSGPGWFSAGLGLPKTWIFWRAVLFCAVFSSAFMFVVQNHYQKEISETRAAVIYSLEPLFAALTAWPWLGEALTPRMVGGGVLILAGMLLTGLRLKGK